MNLKILSALPVLGHPRDSKRIDMLIEGGFGVSAVAFDRDYHNARNLSCSIKILGKIEHGKYISRVFKMIRAIPIFRKEIKKHDVIYASGPDMAFLAILASLGLNKPIVLEIGDIRKIQVNEGWSGRLMRALDKIITNKCSLIVVTSTQFITGYYNEWLRKYPRFLTIENKLEDKIIVENIQQQENVLRIGYFGVLRCNWSWEILKKIAISMGKERVYIVIAGINMLDIDIDYELQEFENMEYIGKYKSPEDLPKLYDQIDLVWACYPSPYETNKNWYWAQLICRSNRFYESCNFEKPIITINGSGDAIEIEKYQIGLVFDNQDDDYILNKVKNVSKEDVLSWKKNTQKMPLSVYINDIESNNLKEAIDTIFKS